jgi:hypothetical protein
MMSWQRSLQAAARALRKEESALCKELDLVRKKLHDLEHLSSGQPSNGSSRRKTGSRRLSPKGRAAISRAAKKRWADYRRDKKKAVRAH